MRVRVRHLVCLLLLVSTLGAGDAAARPHSSFGVGEHYLTALIRHAHATAFADASLPTQIASQRRRQMAARIGDASDSQPPAVRPPQQQAASVHTRTAVRG